MCHTNMLHIGLILTVLHIIYGYENIALNKPTHQSNVYVSKDHEEATFDSSNAVDGLKTDLSAFGGQCVISANGQGTATWWVNLTSIHSIHDIRIYYRTDNALWGSSNGYTARFLGFYVYVSNTTSRTGAHLCFHDTNYTNATIPAVIDIQCPVHGQYVIYYNERPQSSPHSSQFSVDAHNELCEVEVNGCKKPGYYGSNCSIPCPRNCQDRYCHIETGACQGCKPGYQGEQCEQPCSHSFYGKFCSEKCGNCSEGVSCNHVNGTCTNGCNVGVYGDKCKTPCPTGWHGKNCSEMCSNCDRCDRVTGQCTSPCNTGWKGLYCTEECGNKTYGDRCMKKCGACLGYKQCHHINGSCFNGCDVGYKGELCITGCSSGKYGSNCNEECNDNCGVPYACNRMTGECEGGCQPGWEGVQCEHKCSNNMYGQNCSLHCGNCRNATKCYHVNGTCPDGCTRGYKDMHCSTGCSPGTYGFDCIKNCSTSCFNNTCDPIDGYCTKIMKNSPQKSNNDNVGAVIGGLSGLVVIVCLIAVIVVLALRRRRLQKHNSGNGKTDGAKTSKMGVIETKFSTIDSKPTSSSDGGKKRDKTGNEKPLIHVRQKRGDEADVDDDEKIHSENPYGDFYVNETIVRDIPLSQLESVIAEKRMNKDDGFQREYATLPYGERYKCEAGKREENIVKNRFKTTFPYDHSRVKLKTESGSDYINADYIEGAEKNKQYIAAQGPRQNTVCDFWTMIWHECVTTIVMLTNLKEGNKTKCTKYWPDVNKHINYGTVSVQMIEEKEYAFYIIRKMTVNHKETKRSHVVTQYHYTSWPDHGIPDPLCLVVFHHQVTRTRADQITSPTVVHCSAGIGRTGTYIALDVLNQIGKKTGKVNVAEYVKKMRENRMNMVQTYEQYMTIFLALNEIFKSPVKSNSIEEFTKKAKTMMTDEPANQGTLRKEFQLLMKIRPTYKEDDFKVARESCGDIYFNGILPLDKYNVYLSSVVPKRGNFINAIYVPSFTNSKAFIVTHYPPIEDAVDFLRLLNDHESDTVVCMDPLNKIDSSKAWYPSPSSSKTVLPFTAHFQSNSGTDVNSTIVHFLQKYSEEEVHPVTVIEPKVSIRTSGNPLDTSQLRSLVSATLAVETENPITIVSSDGASLCGVFCAVYNLIQHINMDNSVDVFTAVRQLQVRRPEFCSKIDEYRLVIKAVLDHTQSTTESIYCNQ